MVCVFWFNKTLVLVVYLCYSNSRIVSFCIYICTKLKRPMFIDNFFLVVTLLKFYMHRNEEYDDLMV